MNTPMNVEMMPEGTQLFTLEQIAVALLRANGITSGLWRLGCHLSFGGATSLWNEIGTQERALPTALVGITGLGLTPVSEPGPLVFDAAEHAGLAGKPRRKVQPKPRKA